MLTLLLLAAQVLPALPPPQPGAERFSILLTDPCPASTGTEQEIIVCGRRQADDRLSAGPGTPSGGNPALRAEAVPCAAVQGGCASFLDLKRPALLLAGEIRIGISTLADRSRDKSRRVPIALEGAGPSWHLEP